MKLRPYIVFLFSYVLYFQVNAQSGFSSEKYLSTFLRDTVKVNSGQMAFNTINLLNQSNLKQQLTCEIILPSKWRILNQIEPLITLESGSQQSIPFRIIPDKAALGGLVYPISIKIYNSTSNSTKFYNFFIKINQTLKWNASLPKQSISISRKDSTSFFQVYISNKGNKRELYTVDFKTSLRLSHGSSGTQILLRPQEDTLLKVFVKNRFFEVQDGTVEVLINSRGGTQSMVQYVEFVTDNYKMHSTPYGFMPINVSYSLFNPSDKATRFSLLDIDGSYEINKKTNIAFKLRQGLNSDLGIPPYYSVSLNARKFRLSAGSILDFMNYQIDGNGLSLNLFTKERSNSEIFALKNRIGDSYLLGLKNYFKLTDHNLLETKALFILDNIQQTSGFFNIHQLEFNKKQNRTLVLNGGYSTEKNALLGISKQGNSYGAKFEYFKKSYSFRSNYISYSKYFVGLNRGFRLSEHELMFSGKNFRLGGFFDENSRFPAENINPEFNTLWRLATQNLDFGGRLQTSIRRLNLNLSLSNTLQKIQNDSSSDLSGRKLNLQTTYSRNRFTSFQTITFNQNKYAGQTTKTYLNGFSIFSQIKYRDFGLMTTVDKGINYVYDYQYYKLQNSKPFRQNYALYFDLKSKGGQFVNRINLAYVSIKNVQSNSLVLRQDMNIDLPKSKTQILIQASFDLLNVTTIPNVNLTLRKSLAVPISFRKKYHTASLFLFKDKNNNQIFDKDEQVLNEALISVGGHKVMSNEKGMVYLKNAEKGTYLVDLKNIFNIKGWISQKGLRDTLKLEKDMALGLPFKMSKVISGKVQYQKLYDTEALDPTLGGVLVLAVNKDGEIFKTLTDEKGEFYFNLNDDIYNVQVPDGVFNNNLYIEKSVKRVDLFQAEQANLIFKISQKKRQINIKKL